MNRHTQRLVGAVTVLMAAALACSLPTTDGNTATPAPSDEDTPAPSPDTPPPPQPAILFEDDFDDPNSGWEVGDYPNGSVGYGNGFYIVTSVSEGGTMWGVAGESLEDLVLEVDATQVEAPANDNNAYGVGCRIQPDGDGYYLRISGDGFYSISKAVEGIPEYLVGWTSSDDIQLGNATNRIRAVCDGSRLILFANDQRLASFEDTTYTSGDIALTATTFESESTEVHFDNLVVREPIPQP